MGKKTMKCLVTGSAGFLGQYLTEELVKQGHQVYGYDLKTSTIFPQEQIDIVYHLASHVNAFESVSDPMQGFDNVEILANVLEWMRNSGVQNIIFSSSRECYSCVNPYGASKLACEAFLRAYCASYGFSAVSCRLANLYGAGNLGFRFVDATIKSARKNEDIVVYGGDEKLLNFLHVTDAVDYLISAQSKLRPGHHEIIECAYPISYSLIYLAELIVGKLKSSSRIVSLPNRRGETLRYIPKVINRSPKVTIEEGIEECLVSLQ